MAARDVVSSLQREVELAKEGLKNVDEDIKKLTGRDPSESRGPAGNRRIVVKRNFGERIGGPPQKRFNSGNVYNRVGPRENDRNNRRFGQLESDGEEEEDDGNKPTLQSSIVATPAPSRQQEVKPDKKTQTRNKRMFGVLMGTLQKFKENSNKEAARERKRKQIEKKLEEAAVQEREQAIRKKKELFLARKEQQTKLEDLERKIEVAEMLEEWEEHDRKLSKFIRTNTKPHIFYLPAKHNDYTLGLLEKTAEHVEDSITKRRQEVAEVLHKSGDEEQDHGQNESVLHEDDEEPDVKQEVDHSDDEGNSRRKGMKGGRRTVILTSRTRESESKDDDMGETNEKENEKVEKEKSRKREVVLVEDENEMEMEMKRDEREVEDERVDLKVEVEVKNERDVEMSDVNETKMKSDVNEEEKSEIEASEVEEKNGELGKVQEEQGTQLDVTGDVGGCREHESISTNNFTESTAGETNDERSSSANDVAMSNVAAPEANVQNIEDYPDDGEKNESESKMLVDPVQENDENDD